MVVEFRAVVVAVGIHVVVQTVVADILVGRMAVVVGTAVVAGIVVAVGIVVVVVEGIVVVDIAEEGGVD